MKALITGASSGMGRDMAKILSQNGYDLILVARDEKKLEEVKKQLKTETKIVVMDISNEENCKKIYEENKDIDILINNAGFGDCGHFEETSLDKDIQMIHTNIIAYHILTKLYLKEMIKKDSGRILNVASTAAFLPGPLMSTYYSTNSYVYELTTAIFEELRRIKSNVKVSVLCPGPVNTNFNNVAGVNFAIKGLSSDYVTSYALDKMFKNKLVIIPGFANKLAKVACKFASLRLLLKVDYNIQRKKEK